MFDGLSNPHVPSYNATEQGPVPSFMKKFKPLTAWEMQRQDMGFRNRSSSAVDLDRLLGVVMERFLLRPLHLKEMPQTLLTFGLLFIFSDLAMLIWGGNPQTVPKPELFRQSIDIGGMVYPSYRLFIIGFGLFVAAVLWWVQEGTRIGAMVRAGVDNEEIARALGINVSLLFTMVFALGAFLAALGGVMGGPIVGVYPGADFEVLLMGFVVVIIGGLGSLKGALVGGLIVGLLDNFGKVFFPEFALFTIFAPMALILAVRPTGLFGKE